MLMPLHVPTERTTADLDHERDVVLAYSQGCGDHLREYEPIPVQPVWILRVEVHEFVEEDVGNGRHAHRGPGMPGIGFEGSIDLRQHNGYVSVDFARLIREWSS